MAQWVSEESWWAELFQLLLENAGTPELELVKRHLAFRFFRGFPVTGTCCHRMSIGVVELLADS